MYVKTNTDKFFDMFTMFIHHLSLSPGSPAGWNTEEMHGFTTQELPHRGADHSSTIS